MECYWIRTSEYDLGKLREASKGVAVIPLASIESHGPHLPLGSDSLCLENLVKRVVARETVAVLPPLLYTFVVQARQLPGAIHIQSDLLMAYVENICDEVHRNGFGKVVLLHGHGGNVALHQMFINRALEKEKPYTVYSIPVLLAGERVRAVLESKETGHACEMETSMNLVAAPELVNLKRLGKKTFPSLPGPDVGAALVPGSWIMAYPEAAIGEPQKATEEKGAAIMSAWADAVVKVLRKIKRDKMTPAFLKQFVRKANAAGAKTQTRKRKRK